MMQTWHNANLAIIASIHISLNNASIANMTIILIHISLDDASIANMAIISIHISLDDASIASVFIASIHIFLPLCHQQNRERYKQILSISACNYSCHN